MSDAELKISDILALDRTQLAAERTLGKHYGDLREITFFQAAGPG